MKNAHLGALEVSRIGLGAMTMAGIDSSPANVKAAIEGSLKPDGTAIMEGADMGQAKTWTAFDVHVSVVAATLDRDSGELLVWRLPGRSEEVVAFAAVRL